MTAFSFTAVLLALALGGLLAGAPVSAHAQKSPAPMPLGALAPPKEEGDLPLRITADRLEAEQEKGLIIFSGKVKAQRGEAALYCDQLLVYYQPERSAGPGSPEAGEGKTPGLMGQMGGGEKIDRIEARGQVRYVQDDKVATGDTAIYYQDRGEIILTGNPKVWQGDNSLKGDRIIFRTRENRVLVESSSRQRVEAFLYQGGSAGEAAPSRDRSPRQTLPAATRPR